MSKSLETTFYRLDHYIARYGHSLPQIVTVGDGFHGTSVNPKVQSGEVLIIYKIEKRKKILARDIGGRELCFPRKSNWKVEIVNDNLENEYDTPVHVQSRNTGSLPSYRIFSIEHVLREFSLPLKVRLVPAGQTTALYYSERGTPSIEKLGKVHIEREIEEETVFAISPYNEKSILTFPHTLGILVTECMPQSEFLSRSGTEYRQFLRTIENDRVLQNAINNDCVYFTSEPIRRYLLEMLRFPCFRFERKETRIIAATESCVEDTKQHGLMMEELSLDSPIQQRTAQQPTVTFAGRKGTQPWSYSENRAPPLPPKMTLPAGKYHVTSKKEQLERHYTESRQESEKNKNFLKIGDKQEAEDDQHYASLVMLCDPHENPNIETTRRFKSMPRPRNETRVQLPNENFFEHEDVVFSASEPQLDVNANLPVNSGSVGSLVVRKGTLPNNFQTKQPSCSLPSSLSGIKTWQELNTSTTRKVTNTANCHGHTMHKYSASSVAESLKDEDNGTQLSPESLIRKQNGTRQDASAVTNKEAQNKKHKMCKYSTFSTEQSLSDEDNEETDGLNDLNFHDYLEGRSTSNTCGTGGGVDNTATAELSPCHEEGSSEKVCSANGGPVKKGLFHSLTRKPKWFRQDANKPKKREKVQVSKAKSEAVRIPPRHTASCEDLWISSPQDDDFECLGNITKYLETRDKLTRALVKINCLEKQTSNPADEADSRSGNTTDMSHIQEESSGKERKGLKENTDDIKSQSDLRGNQVVSSKQSSNHSFSTKVKSTFSTSMDDLKDHSESSKYETVCPALNQDRTTKSRFEMPHNIQALTTSYDDLHLTHLNWHSKGHSTGRDKVEQDSCKTCFCSNNPYFTDVFGGDLPDWAAKQELKKTILQMEWSKEEWEELTDIVARKIQRNCKRVNLPYVNLAPYGRRDSLPVDQTVVDSSGVPGAREGHGMPPYININQGRGIPGTPPYNLQARQQFVDDMQRLASRSLGKPPIPTPRDGRSSV